MKLHPISLSISALITIQCLLTGVALYFTALPQWALPPALILILALLALELGALRLRRNHSIVQIIPPDEKQSLWILKHKNGEQEAASIMKSSIATHFMLFLYFRNSQNKKRVLLVLPHQMDSYADFHRLLLQILQNI